MNAEDILVDLPGWLDAVIATIWLAVAILHGILIGRIGSTPERWLRLFGWSILAVTWAYRLVMFGSVRVSAPSVAAILLIATASIVGARRQLREWEADVRCYRDKHLKCHRADRVEMVLKQRDK